MAVIGRWGGQNFTVTSKLIYGFTDLTIKGSSKTEDKESGGQSYVSRKSGNATQITLNVGLSALVGVTDVRATALWFVNNARAGKSDYFYVGEKKLFEKKVMLTDASVDKVELSPGGKWVSCEVKLTFKESEASGGGGGGGSSGGGSGGGGSGGGGSGGGGSGKKSSKKKTVKKPSAAAAAGAAASAAIGVIASVVQKGISAAAAIVKKADTARKTAAPIKRIAVKPVSLKNKTFKRISK